MRQLLVEQKLLPQRTNHRLHKDGTSLWISYEVTSTNVEKFKVKNQTNVRLHECQTFV